MIAEEGGNFELAAWDWRYYAEKLRKERYDLDEAEIKPYFQLEKMIEAAFDTAHRLFGLDFHERKDVPVYHPDVRVWEVTRGGAHVGLFYGDYFARTSKRGGAWMSSFRDQENFVTAGHAADRQHLQFSARASRRCCRSTRPRRCSTNSATACTACCRRCAIRDSPAPTWRSDFVELPSQIFEHWLEEPQVLEKFAVHAETGKADSQDAASKS